MRGDHPHRDHARGDTAYRGPVLPRVHPFGRRDDHPVHARRSPFRHACPASRALHPRHERTILHNGVLRAERLSERGGEHLLHAASASLRVLLQPAQPQRPRRDAGAQKRGPNPPEIRGSSHVDRAMLGCARAHPLLHPHRHAADRKRLKHGNSPVRRDIHHVRDRACCAARARKPRRFRKALLGCRRGTHATHRRRRPVLLKIDHRVVNGLDHLLVLQHGGLGDGLLLGLPVESKRRARRRVGQRRA